MREKDFRRFSKWFFIIFSSVGKERYLKENIYEKYVFLELMGRA